MAMIVERRSMNWKSKSISEVAKEKIWKEHVENERIRIFDAFHKNPYHAAKDKPLPEPVNRREARFLDRERSFLETIERRVAAQTPPSLTSHDNDADRVMNGTKPHRHAPELRQETGSALLPPIATNKSADGVADSGKQTGDAKDSTRDFGLHWARVQSIPSQRYAFPMTEAQELGWLQPETVRRDPRFNYNLSSSDATRFASLLKLPRYQSKGNKV